MKYIPFEVKAAKLEESYKNPYFTYTEQKFKIEQAKYGKPYNLLKILLDGYSGGVVKSELQVHDGYNLSITSDPLPTGEVLTRIRK